ncbi:CLUMA_CG003061, isoform A [Clunio marinus]|uniref:CLUMA_CG003061, isoform A n=1 Tax=Clunio marinus TaxID=568069 RepID=A0A1J1HS50_9DIPT|nr:CLUMA_CG003061, isoform A [Clunio marinus]
MESDKQNNSFDIVSCLPSEIVTNIFNRLDGKDILAASEVSTKWRNFIAESSHCLRKITLNLRQMILSNVKNPLYILTNNPRSYESIFAPGVNFCKKSKVAIIMSTSTRWKNIKIESSEFHARLDYSDFFSRVEETLEDLRMKMVKVKDHSYSKLVRDMKFSKLTILQAYDVEHFFYENVFVNLTTLRQLLLRDRRLKASSKDAIVQLLRRNNDLKVLELSDSCFTDVMETQNIINGIQFKLEKLIIGGDFYDSFNYFKNLRNNFVRFLSSQKHTLTSLVFHSWMGLSVLKYVYQLPNLKFLCIKNVDRINELIDWTYVTLPKSNSLERVTLIDFPGSLELMKTFATATANANFNVTFNPYAKFDQRIEILYRIRRIFGKSLNLKFTNWY